MSVWILVLISAWFQDKQVITFPAGDGVIVHADLYAPHDSSAPMILLFHQANWSRGEYAEIAPKLNEMGFNCMAVDLRSGGKINSVINQTNQSASQLYKETRYIDALPDVHAAIDYAKKNHAKEKLIIWGSSYSASLVLKIAGDHDELIDGALAFSPGEYFTSQGKPRNFVSSSAANIEKPVFITSAQNEKSNWWGMYVSISAAEKAYFIPASTGNHGSRALWSRFEDSEAYWSEVKTFLQTFK